MKRTITALWHSDIAEVGCMTNTNPIMDDLWEMLSGEEARLRELLTGEQAELFQNYVKFMSDYIRLASEQAFVSGFSTGARLVVECMQDEW